MMQQDNRSPSLEQLGLSVLKFCSSSKPFAHRQALMIAFSLTNFSFITYLREMHCWSKSSISSYTCSFRHRLSSIILASSCCNLFVVINVSWIWVSSSFISFKDRLDRRFDNSSSFFDFVWGSFVISLFFFLRDRSIIVVHHCLKYSSNLKIFQSLFLHDLLFLRLSNYYHY